MDSRQGLKHWSLGLLGLGLACLVTARILGAEVDEDGMLREPFALLPIGWFAISLGLILGAIHLFGRLFGPRPGPPRDPD